MRHPETAIGIIDAQRGFMPAAEGTRLGLPGFGELPVPGGEHIVPVVNQLLAGGALRGYYLFTTQDRHPAKTGHFVPEGPWPSHCVDGTPGMELHPEIIVPATADRFYKGRENLVQGQPDTSYSGFGGRTEAGVSLPERLRQRHIRRLDLGGLALDYCVRQTALDGRRQGMDVAIIESATAAVASESEAAARAELIQAGVDFIDMQTWLARGL